MDEQVAFAGWCGTGESVGLAGWSPLYRMRYNETFITAIFYNGSETTDWIFN